MTLSTPLSPLGGMYQISSGSSASCRCLVSNYSQELSMNTILAQYRAWICFNETQSEQGHRHARTHKGIAQGYRPPLLRTLHIGTAVPIAFNSIATHNGLPHVLHLANYTKCTFDYSTLSAIIYTFPLSLFTFLPQYTGIQGTAYRSCQYLNTHANIQFQC